MPSKMTINGRTFVGTNIQAVNGRVFVDGVEVTDPMSGAKTPGILEVRVLEGVVGELKADGAVTCGDVTGNVKAGGSVRCGDVGGNVNAGGSIQAGHVQGDLNAGGSVSIRK